MQKISRDSIDDGEGLHDVLSSLLGCPLRDGMGEILVLIVIVRGVAQVVIAGEVQVRYYSSFDEWNEWNEWVEWMERVYPYSYNIGLWGLLYEFVFDFWWRNRL